MKLKNATLPMFAKLAVFAIPKPMLVWMIPVLVLHVLIANKYVDGDNVNLHLRALSTKIVRVNNCVWKVSVYNLRVKPTLIVLPVNFVLQVLAKPTLVPTKLVKTTSFVGPVNVFPLVQVCSVPKGRCVWMVLAHRILVMV